MADDLRAAAKNGVPFSRVDGTGDDPTGECSFVGIVEKSPDTKGGYFSWCKQVWFSSQTDAWGNRIRFRCPGVVHRRGWDLYSVGPDGIDEGGGGDDILVGEDVATVSSSR